MPILINGRGQYCVSDTAFLKILSADCGTVHITQLLLGSYTYDCSRAKKMVKISSCTMNIYYKFDTNMFYVCMFVDYFPGAWFQPSTS